MFSDASLQNSYAFFLNGTRRSTGGVFLRAGSFIADGQGHITGGIEDLNEQGDITQDLLFDGIYSVGPDGRGWVQFCELVNSLCTTPPSTFRIVMASAQRVQITEFDQFITATGEMELQDPSAFTSAGLSGNYTFDFFGLLSSLTAKSVVGELSANGNGSILSGEIDINNDGTLTNLPILKTSTHSISANGRGTARLVTSTQTLTFSFYIVSSGSTKFIGPDPTSILGGEAYAQQLSTLGKWGLNALKGDFIFQTAGSSAAGEITDAGRFTADGNGNIEPGSGILDEHHSGYVTLAAPFGGTYTLDATERGTLTFLSEITYTFYMVSSSKAVIQETGSSIVADGLLLAQTGGGNHRIFTQWHLCSQHNRTEKWL